MTAEERGKLYDKIVNLLKTSGGSARLGLLIKQYGREEVEWMLKVIKEDVEAVKSK